MNWNETEQKAPEGRARPGPAVAQPPSSCIIVLGLGRPVCTRQSLRCGHQLSTCSMSTGLGRSRALGDFPLLGLLDLSASRVSSALRLCLLWCHRSLPFRTLPVPPYRRWPAPSQPVSQTFLPSRKTEMLTVTTAGLVFACTHA